MNTKNPVSALRMETGGCYITEVLPTENVSAKNFPWNTVKNTLTHTRHFPSLYLNVTSSPYPIVSATFPQTNWHNNHIFYTISKLSCDKDHICRPFMGSSLQNSRDFKTAQYDMLVQWPGKAKTTTVAKLSSWRGFVVYVVAHDNKIVNRLAWFTQEKTLYLPHCDSSSPGGLLQICTTKCRRI